MSDNVNPWGDAYRIAMAKTRAVMARTEKPPDILGLFQIIKGLFRVMIIVLGLLW